MPCPVKYSLALFCSILLLPYSAQNSASRIRKDLVATELVSVLAESLVSILGK